MNDKYDDIINLPHHVSKTHKRMPIADRAAQFSAFAALKDYDEAVDETARITENRIDIYSNQFTLMDGTLILFNDIIGIESDLFSHLFNVIFCIQNF